MKEAINEGYISFRFIVNCVGRSPRPRNYGKASCLYSLRKGLAGHRHNVYSRNWVSGFTPSFKTTTSTLLFSCRPSEVLLLATGYFFPYPLGVIRSFPTPLSTSAFSPASARFLERSRLYSSDPTLSVWPSIKTLRFGCFLRKTANLSTLRNATGDRVALSKAT